MPSRLIHIVATCQNLFFLLQLNTNPLDDGPYLFIHSSTNEQQVCFHLLLLPTVNAAAIGMGVQISLQNIVIISFRNTSRGGVHWMLLWHFPKSPSEARPTFIFFADKSHCA